MRAAILGLGIMMGMSSLAVAAIPKAQVAPTRILIGNSSTQGGKSGQALSLMDVRHSASKNGKMERLVLDFGSSDLKEAKGLVGYYHAELQENPARLVLELPQTYASRLPEKEILKRLQKSAYVRTAQIGFDRNLQSMTMVFQFKKPVQARVARVSNPESSGKIVIDLAADTPQARANIQKQLARRQQARLAAQAGRPANRLAAPATRTRQPAVQQKRNSQSAPQRGSNAIREIQAERAPTAPSFIDSAPVKAKKSAARKDSLTDADRAAAQSIQSPAVNR